MNRQNNPQKKSPVAALIAVLLVLGAFAGNDLDGEVLAFVIPVVVVVAVLAVCFRVLLRKKGAGRMESSGGKNSIPHIPEGRSRSLQSFAIHRPDPRSKNFVKPDAPCIVCENTGEDHLERDKQNRIRQLDDWLKSGLIDRKEYHVLKERYQRDL